MFFFHINTRIFKGVLILFLVSFGSIFSASYSLVLDQSLVTFSIEHTRDGLVKGGFSDIQSELFLADSDDVPKQVRCTINVGSLDTSSGVRDRHLKSRVFFYEKKYPVIVFNSESIELLKEGVYVAEGPLVIRDKMKRIRIPFQAHKVSQNRFVIEAELDVDRHAFDLSAYGRLIGGTAKVVLSAVYEQ